MKTRKALLLVITFLAALTLNKAVFAAPVPDTNQTGDYTATFGEDSDYTINPHSYTKLDTNGVELPENAADWLMVRDNVTGLVWEVKHNKDSVANYSNPNDADNSYTWYDGSTGTPGNNTDTQDFINNLNAAYYGGFNDWRMPTIKELSFLRDSSRFGPAINTGYFPNIKEANAYWSSTNYVGLSGYAWIVQFNYGKTQGSAKANTSYVRAVRGAQSANSFVDNDDGTVTDTSTGLMWQQVKPSSTYTWVQALNYCEGLTLAEFDDWRLPNQNELQSLVNYNRYDPAIYTTYFTGSQSITWSYNSNVNSTSNAWYVNFTDGSVNEVGSKSTSYFVRAVRCGDANDMDCDGIPDEEPTAVTIASFAVQPKNGIIIIRWSTSSEIDNASFNIYRAESEDGNYLKINDSLIPAKGSPIKGAFYEFADSDVHNRITYYYKLEDIDIYGKSTMHGPVSATPRLFFGMGK
jgi:hypothetical protein